MNNRELLLRLACAPCGGTALAREYGLTRAAVWKHIRSLREAGVEVLAQPGTGYRLAAPLDLLDASRLQAALAPGVAARIDALEVAWDIDSTNAALLRCPATAGVQVLLAERQSAGRGRRGRTWASPLAAHVYLSLQRRFDGGVAALSGLSIAVGVAAAETLHALGFDAVGLKWPNDLVVGNRKLGGVLIEFAGEDAGMVRVVVGTGINVRMPAKVAAGIDQPWIDLRQLRADLPTRNALAAALVSSQVRALDQFANAGLAPFLPRWRALDALRDQPIDVLAGTQREAGVALGIGDGGALRVRHADGEREYHSAEISVRVR